MTKKYSRWFKELRQHQEFTKEQCGGDNAATEAGQVVLVAMAGFIEQAMCAQSFKQILGTAWQEMAQMGAQVRGPQAPSVFSSLPASARFLANHFSSDQH